MKAKREEQIETAHDLAMFGAPVSVPPVTTCKEVVAEAKAEAEAEAETEAEANAKIKDSSEIDLATSLLSEKVFFTYSFSFERE